MIGYECRRFIWVAGVLADGPNADFFAPAVEDTSNLIVPSITRPSYAQSAD
jgi:hypothetical protein